MFQVLEYTLFAIIGLSIVSIMIFVYFPILTVRPFDYRKVSYRAGAASILMALSGVGLMVLYDEQRSPLTLNTVLFWLVIAAFMIGFALVVSYFVFLGLRSLSATFAQREERIAEQKRQRESEHAGDAPTDI